MLIRRLFENGMNRPETTILMRNFTENISWSVLTQHPLRADFAASVSRAFRHA